ncbi:MAG: ABC transporter permease [Candidatus Odinarchaeota archaeon]
MNGFFAAFWAESLKIRRSKMFWMITLSFSFISVMMGVLMFIAKYPELAQNFGLLGTKSSLLQIETNWPTYLGFLYMGIAMGGSLGFGFVTSWVFGREYSDHTIKDLLALPISRLTIVLVKFLAIFVWCFFLSFLTLFLGLVFGSMIGLTGGTTEVISNGIYTFIGTSVLTILLCMPVAFFASYGRGYLLPMGYVILTMVITQFVGLLGFAPYFPWSIPVLFSGVDGTDSTQLGIISYAILALTSGLGVVTTSIQWNFADQY